jgi:Protein of unknown function (DUF2971)
LTDERPKAWWTEPQVDYFRLDREDQYVYRYRTHERAIQELKTRKIRMSPFAELNDPKESNNWRFDLASSDSRQGFDPNVEREIEESGTVFAKGHAKVLCVTLDDASAVGMGVENIWGRGFSRPRMWQQYGENYRGVCMIFDRVALDRIVQAARPEGPVLMAGRVIYGNTPRVFRLSLADHPFMLDYDSVVAAGLQQAVFEHVIRHRDRLFFEKAIDWQSEKERRWVIWDNTHSELFLDIGDALKGVIVGSEFSNDVALQEEFQDLCASDKILVYQLHWRNGSPDINFLRLPTRATSRGG